MNNLIIITLLLSYVIIGMICYGFLLNAVNGIDGFYTMSRVSRILIRFALVLLWPIALLSIIVYAIGWIIYKFTEDVLSDLFD